MNVLELKPVLCIDSWGVTAFRFQPQIQLVSHKKRASGKRLAASPVNISNSLF
ncbi:MAG: hypothetical protein QNI97_02465 [Desulfobacterales bacterium]|nr:hypothetical protein [Desulfobacterales bacterium]